MKLFAMIFILFTCTGLVSNGKDTEQERKKWRQAMRSEKNLNQEALDHSLQFLTKNHLKKKLTPYYIAIADFSQTSNKKRLAIINTNSRKVEYYKVSHGKGSDKNHDLKLDKFSSKPGSYATPKGFHKMTTTYYGKHGLSLRMEGLEDHNKNSRSRAIVLHGADYVSWAHTGRSQGCPAVEKKHLKKIVERLKGGALFYFYKDDKR